MSNSGQPQKSDTMFTLKPMSERGDSRTVEVSVPKESEVVHEASSARNVGFIIPYILMIQPTR